MIEVAAGDTTVGSTPLTEEIRMKTLRLVPTPPKNKRKRGDAPIQICSKPMLDGQMARYLVAISPKTSLNKEEPRS